ncbi:MAG: hypothetical protein L0Y56_19565 [Nitrospira sp.]|nr:hypothetical protein [Nitrospira sp.]
MREYYHLVSLSRDPCESDEKWWESAVASEWICRGCYSMSHRVSLPDVKLAVMPDKASLNFIPATDLMVVSRDFVEALGDDVVSQYTDLGRLIGPGGEIINSYYSFMGKYTILIRTNKSSTRICDVCGRRLYCLNPRDRKRYLIASQVGTSPIYHAQIGLVVEDILYEKIRQTKPRKLSAGKIAIKNKASDGLDF